jgi:hypothetical protein
MGFKIGKAYSREKIAAELGIARDLHSVLMADGMVLAIVANTNGFNRLNGKQYRNVLTADAFVMRGENDGRGHQLELTSAVPLFYAHDDNGYRYEGKVTWAKTVDTDGAPWREFTRLTDR